MPLGYLVIDMNSYFASVEQHDNPRLRGKPVAVVAVDTDSTSVIAASQEAKKFGVKTGTKVYDARKLCPQLTIIQSHPERYVQVHDCIKQAVESVIHIQDVMSIDEMLCRLPLAERDEPTARKIALDIKAAIRAHVGECLTSSIGIAPNPMLAKVASDMQKPDGLTVIRTEELPHRLYRLELRDFPGIGAKMEARLRYLGIATTQSLCQASESLLARAWQSPLLGKLWFHYLRGDDLPPRPRKKSSIGHSHVLPPAMRNPDGAHRVLICMLHKAAARLRKEDYYADNLSIELSYIDDRHYHAIVPLEGSRDTLTMIRAIKPLWENRHPGTLLKVGVVLSGLEKAACATLPLFQKAENLGKLAHAMDAVNEKFGSNRIFFAGMQGAQDRDTMRIAFTRIPSLHPESAPTAPQYPTLKYDDSEPAPL